MNDFNIIMYHYVRNQKLSKFKKLKYLSQIQFKNQLDYLEDNFEILDPKILLHKTNKINLNSCILTFDDGYKDHIKFVLPELKKRKLRAAFFPTGITSIENKPLDANLIQHILALTNNYKKLKKDVINLSESFGIKKNILKKCDKYILENKNH